MYIICHLCELLYLRIIGTLQKDKKQENKENKLPYVLLGVASVLRVIAVVYTLLLWVKGDANIFMNANDYMYISSFSLSVELFAFPCFLIYYAYIRFVVFRIKYNNYQETKRKI